MLIILFIYKKSKLSNKYGKIKIFRISYINNCICNTDSDCLEKLNNWGRSSCSLYIWCGFKYTCRPNPTAAIFHPSYNNLNIKYQKKPYYCSENYIIIIHFKITITRITLQIKIIFLQLINFFNGWSSSSSSSSSRWCSGTRHTTRHTIRHTASSLVQLGDNWIADSFNLLLLLLKFFLLSQLISIKPLDDLIAFVQDNLFIFITDLAFDFVVFNGALHIEAVSLETIFGSNSLLLFLILKFVLFSFIDHPFNLLLAKSSLVIGDSNLILLSGHFISSRNIENSIGVNVKGDLNLRDSSGCRRNTRQFKLSKKIVVLGHGTFSLVDLNEHTGLIVRVGGESLGLFGWNGSVTLDQSSHHASSGLNSKRQWRNIQQKKILNGF
ncbi:Similar to NAD-specific glutamate dehydrogenase (Achlya klebsiana) [Cotesia congregata]|uniref:Similar to NAD-specific glutamate dehydrogenase (Achlya klebsiana) n=1 Tax=Cotesia congregata TaxID=51543 RepID=A0A8J2E5X9_COTCN|nr:Similar to NAD-specific glutamate dehydrogenase (Achlya klebsiana) [Cotesia congregata]